MGLILKLKLYTTLLKISYLFWERSDVGPRRLADHFSGKQLSAVAWIFEILKCFTSEAKVPF